MRTRTTPARRARHAFRGVPMPRRRASLCETLNQVLDTGVVAMGEVVISIAGVDLLYLNLNVLLSSVETLLNAMETPGLEGEKGGASRPALSPAPLGHSKESEILCNATR